MKEEIQRLIEEELGEVTELKTQDLVNMFYIFGSVLLGYGTDEELRECMDALPENLLRYVNAATKAAIHTKLRSTVNNTIYCEC